MKRILFYGMVILVSLSFSSLFWLYGLYQGRLADAHESFSAFDFQDADRNYGEAAGYLNYVRNISWFLTAEQLGIKSRRLEVSYWLGRYDDLISDFQPQPGSDNTPTSEEDFITGNAFYRILETEKDNAKVIGLLDSAISKYADAVNGDVSNLNAAFNYEYLLQTRDDVADGKRKLPLKKQGKEQSSAQNQGDQPGSIHGQEGAQSSLKDTDKILIHVPMSGDELKEKDAEDAGRGVTKRKKG